MMKPIQQAYKVSPRLRMYANGDEEVNEVRAEQSSVVAVPGESEVLGEPAHMPAFGASVWMDGAVAADLPEPVPATGEDEPPDEVYVNIYVQLREGKDRIPAAIRANAQDGSVTRRFDLISAAVPISALSQIASDKSVVNVEPSERIAFTPPLEMSLETGSPAEDWQRLPPPEGSQGGAGVIIGIIDVEGFDFAHPDFLDAAGNTRFLSIWDQGGESHAPPKDFAYGAEITQEMMNAAIQAAQGGLPATRLEPQSQMVTGAHGTHVASIAAGNRGVCPQAYIAAVLVALPEEDTDRRVSFYDSSRITHAVEYLLNLAREARRPIAINISLGTNGHAHDGSSVSSRWIDYAMTTPGRAVCVAAGNAGQEKAAAPGDRGWVMGRIHTSGQVAQNASLDIEWVVVGDGLADLSENEMELWYNAQDHFGVQIKPPDSDWTEIVMPNEFIENRRLPSRTVLSIFNELYSPANGANHIACYLSPFYSKTRTVGIRPGVWRVRLHGVDVRDGGFHAWIERDDPQRLGRLGRVEAWSFPSFLSETSNVDLSSISSLGCGHNVIAVANYDQNAGGIHITSSQGPTRDGRSKPDVAAPGTQILAANGFSVEGNWLRMTGTSMASPFAAGVAGLMLAAEPSLTSAQIGSILSRTARPPANAPFGWQNTSGYGVIDPAAALAEVRRYQERKEHK